VNKKPSDGAVNTGGGEVNAKTFATPMIKKIRMRVKKHNLALLSAMLLKFRNKKLGNLRCA
jgi:hypothetical protein